MLDEVQTFCKTKEVVDRESDKYHLILRSLFSEFKPPTY